MTLQFYYSRIEQGLKFENMFTIVCDYLRFSRKSTITTKNAVDFRREIGEILDDSITLSTIHGSFNSDLQKQVIEYGT